MDALGHSQWIHFRPRIIQYSNAIKADNGEGVDISISCIGSDAHVLRFEVRVALECRQCAGLVEIRQGGDPSPKFHFLEEGPVRLGMRVAFDLLDEAGHYHGDGRHDIWLYPGGDCHSTWAVQTVDGAAHSLVRDVYVEIASPPGYQEIYLG